MLRIRREGGRMLLVLTSASELTAAVKAGQTGASHNQLAHWLVLLAQEYAVQEDWRQASACWKAAVELDAHQAAWHLGWLEALSRLGDVKTGLAQAQAGRLRHPRHPGFSAYEVTFLLQRGLVEPGLTAARKLLTAGHKSGVEVGHWVTLLRASGHPECLSENRPFPRNADDYAHPVA